MVVQGGTMRNDSIDRALEKLASTHVNRSDCPELMGAVGCAVYAMEHKSDEATVAGRKTASIILESVANVFSPIAEQRQNPAEMFIRRSTGFCSIANVRWRSPYLPSAYRVV